MFVYFNQCSKKENTGEEANVIYEKQKHTKSNLNYQKQTEEDLQRICLKEENRCDRNNLRRTLYNTRFLWQKETKMEENGQTRIEWKTRKIYVIFA